MDELRHGGATRCIEINDLLLAPGDVLPTPVIKQSSRIAAGDLGGCRAATAAILGSCCAEDMQIAMHTPSPDEMFDDPQKHRYVQRSYDDNRRGRRRTGGGRVRGCRTGNDD